MRKQLIQLFSERYHEFLDKNMPKRLRACILHDALKLLAPNDKPTRYDAQLRTISHGKLHRHALLIRCPDQAFYLDAIKSYMFQKGVQPIVQHVMICAWDRIRQHILPPTQQGNHIMLISIQLPAATVTNPDEILHDFRAILHSVDNTVLDFNAMRQCLDIAMTYLADANPEAYDLLQWIRDDRYLFYGMESGRKRLGMMRHYPNMEIISNGLRKEIQALPKANKAGVEWLHVAASKNHLYSRVNLEIIRINWHKPNSGELQQAVLIGHLSRSARYANASYLPWLHTHWNHIRTQPLLAQSAYYLREIRTLYDRMPKPILYSVDSEQWASALEHILNISTPLHASHQRLVPEVGNIDFLLIAVSRKRFGQNVLQNIQERLQELGLPLCGNRAFADAGNYVVFILAVKKMDQPWPPYKHIEEHIQQCIKFWKDRAKEYVLDAADSINLPNTLKELAHIDPLYENLFIPEQFIQDIQARNAIQAAGRTHVRLHVQCNLLQVHIISCAPILLGQLVEYVQAFGLVTIESNVATMGHNGTHATIHRIECKKPQRQWNMEDLQRLKEGLMRVFNAEADHDPLNALIVNSSIGIEQLAIFICLRNHLVQLYPQASHSVLSRLLIAYPDIAELLLTIFTLRHQTTTTGHNEAAMIETFEQTLIDVPGLSDDYWLRKFLALIQASLRTNAFVRRPADPIAIKIDPRKLSEIPQPAPYREIFVHGRHVEGVHLRAGKIARGGIRFSDRQDDFRTEVLGLMDTQVIKNGQIIPTGAKGGFVVHDKQATREFVLAQYRSFIRALLSITDNLQQNVLTHPQGIYVPDEDNNDPYLVVAADKGTATFSNDANVLSQQQGFWMDDAFASGGKDGYDHKAIGITARGAWVCAAHHLRMQHCDAWHDEVSVVGIGDMSGDVFGNGMLLNPNTKLIAAFNHAYIFLDPKPSLAMAAAERERLFSIGGNWDAYDVSRISTGGGVFKRGAKTILLSQDVRDALDIHVEHLSGEALIQAILKAPVDMLYNGGIGTYIKTAHETHADIRDSANNNVRINAEDLRCKVICEGGNLGMTQDARIQFAWQGGHINTDAIDNAAGVHMSDREVNIKILFSTVLSTSTKQRNTLLKQMTEEVTAQCLQHNEMQAQALTLAAFTAQYYWPRLIRLRDVLVSTHYLPGTEHQIQDNERLHLRPQLSILLGAEKNRVHDALDAQNYAAWSCFSETFLHDYFPKRIQRRFADSLHLHPMAATIIHTQASNHAINHLGLGSIYHLESLTDQPVANVVHALLIAEHIMDAPSLRHALWNIDLQDSASRLQHLQETVVRLAGELLQLFDVRMLNDAWAHRLQQAMKALESTLLQEASHEQLQHLCDIGLEASLAKRLLICEKYSLAVCAMHVAQTSKKSLRFCLKASHACFAVLPFHILETTLHTPLWGNDQQGHLLRREWLHRLSKLKSKATRQLIKHATSTGKQSFIPIGEQQWKTHAHWAILHGLLQHSEHLDHDIHENRLQLVVYLTQLESLIDECCE